MRLNLRRTVPTTLWAALVVAIASFSLAVFALWGHWRDWGTDFWLIIVSWLLGALTQKMVERGLR